MASWKGGGRKGETIAEGLPCQNKANDVPSNAGNAHSKRSVQKTIH
jgi:hypothetical protein